jgi:hypothetical protein
VSIAGSRTRRHPILWTSIGLIAAGIAIALVGIPLGGLVDGVHAAFHASSAIVVAAIPLAGILIRPTPRRTTTIAWWGMALLAAAFLVEAIGGFGFGPNGEGRNDLAVIHDVSLGTTPLAMLVAIVAVVIGLTGAVAAGGSGRRARIAAAVVGVVSLALLLRLFAMLVGLA